MTTTQDEIYRPPNCPRLSDIPPEQIRVGIQGPPFEGKTTASLTFPNPIILSIDRKVSAHTHRDDVILIPFHDVKFVNSIVPKDGMNAPVNRKEALIKWLSTEGTKLSRQQTLILDGSTGIEEEYHIWYKFHEQELALSKTGQIDSFVEWNLKKKYFEELHLCLKSVPANIVYICHETADRDKKGELNGKVRPLLTGQSGDKLGGNLTDLFRAMAVSKPRDKEQADKLIKWAGIDAVTLAEWVASTPPVCQTIYLWQTQADELCDCGTSSMLNAPKYVLAHYNSFLKYGKKQTTQQLTAV